MCEGIVIAADGSGGCSEEAHLYCKPCDQVLCKGCFEVIHARGKRAEHSTALPKLAAELRSQLAEEGAEEEGGLDGFFLTAAEKAALPEWLKHAVQWRAKKGKVNPNAILTRGQGAGQCEQERNFFALFRSSNTSKDVMSELQFVCEEEYIYEWPPGCGQGGSRGSLRGSESPTGRS